VNESGHGDDKRCRHQTVSVFHAVSRPIPLTPSLPIFLISSFLRLSPSYLLISSLSFLFLLFLPLFFPCFLPPFHISIPPPPSLSSILSFLLTLDGKLMNAPSSRRSVTMSVCPFSAATISAVYPSCHNTHTHTYEKMCKSEGVSEVKLKDTAGEGEKKERNRKR
jgi:hypothetical protein